MPRSHLFKVSRSVQNRRANPALVETKPSPQRDEPPGPEGTSELLIGHGLSVGVRLRSGFNLFLGHSIDPIAIGSALRLRVDSGPVAYKLFFHDGSLFSL
jgi:hypothetical protein